MTAQALLERYVRAPSPVLPQSQVPYYYDELRKIEKALGGAYGAIQGTGPYIKMPFGSLMSTADQTAASTTVAYPITYSVLGASSGISYQSGSQITVTHDGFYNIQFSLQFVNISNEPQEIDVWFRKNGVNIENSNSVFAVPFKKNSGIHGHLIGSLNMIMDIRSTDYVELVWRTTSMDVFIETLPARTSPAIPLTPSVIVTLDYLSGL